MDNIIGFHATRDTGKPIAIATSNGNVISEAPYLSQLIEKYGKYQCVVYDMDAFAACILVAIGITKEQSDTLIRKGKLFIDAYTIIYFPFFFFCIGYGRWQNHPEIVFTQMAQTGYLSPEYSEDNSISDAIGKAKQAKQAALSVCDAFKYFGLKTDNIASPIKSFSNHHLANYPTVDDCDASASKMAWLAVKGHWFETYKLGIWDNSFLYDQNGAYAWQMANLPDIRKGKFIEADTPPDNAMLGIADGILETSAEFHPFLVRVGKNNHTPKGTMPNTLGLEAIKLLKKWQLGDFRISKGVWWYPTEKVTYPYRGIMNYLWQKKQQAQNPMQRALATRLYSSHWGVLGRYIPDKKAFAKEFMPFYNYIVEENSKLKVAEACLSNGITPLMVVGDGFISGEMLPLKLSKEMGDWKLAKQGRCMIIAGGAVMFDDDEPARGLALHFGTIYNQMQEQPNKTSYYRAKHSPVTLALARQRDFDDLGKVQKVIRSVSVGFEYGRVFVDRPNTGSDLLTGQIYDSMAWNYSMISHIVESQKSIEVEVE